MIAVVILGLLATIIMPRILNRPEQARRMKAKVDIRSIESALDLFKTDTGRFPTTSEGLEVLVSNPGIKGYNTDCYLNKVPSDPWGNKYVYISPGVHSRDYDLESYGKNGGLNKTRIDQLLRLIDLLNRERVAILARNMKTKNVDVILYKEL